MKTKAINVLQTKLVIMLLFVSISIATLAQTYRGVWVSKADMPTARWYPASAVYENRIYIFGGSQSSSTSPLNIVEAYNPATDTWDTMSPMPTARTQVSACELNGKIYVIGGSSGPLSGWTALGTLEVYDPGTDTWETKTPMTKPRLEMPVAVVNGKIYAIGGMISSFVGQTDVQIYDPEADIWSDGAAMPTARGTHALAVSDTMIYCIGGTLGQSAGWEPLAKVEIYNTKTDQWSETTDLITPRSHLTACILDNKIYTMGGSDVTKSISFSTVESFNISTEGWSAETSMIHMKEAFAAIVDNEKIYTIGGTTAADAGLHAFGYNEVFYPDSVANLPTSVRCTSSDLDYAINCYPNPFASVVEFNISIKTASEINLTIYDPLGKRIKVVLDEFCLPGVISCTWSASAKDGIPERGSIYLYVLRTDRQITTGKLILIN